MKESDETDPRVAARRAFGHDADADQLERLIALDAPATTKPAEPDQPHTPQRQATAWEIEGAERQAAGRALLSRVRQQIPCFTTEDDR